MELLKIVLASFWLLLSWLPTDAQDAAPKLVASSGRQPAIQLREVMKVDDFDRPISSPWPFTSNTVRVFCAPDGIALMQAGFAVAALNGHTSGIARQMHLKEPSGEERNIIGTSDNRLLKVGGAVVSSAKDADIGDWSSFLRERALKVCGL